MDRGRAACCSTEGGQKGQEEGDKSGQGAGSVLQYRGRAEGTGRG